MAVNVIMPQMGESVAEGTVVRWIKKPGDRVERDEPLLEISTDKVDAEIPSPAAGILSRILVKENQTVEVNTVIAEIDSEGTISPDAAKADASTAGPRPGPAPYESIPTTPATVSAVASTQSAPGQARKIRSSPLVRKIAQEHQINLADVQGTGLGGRINKSDVLAYVALRESRPVSAPAVAAIPKPAAALPTPTEPSPGIATEFTGPTQVVPMTPLRRQIADHMVLSQRTAPHAATIFEAEMTKVSQSIAIHGAEFERRNGIKLTYTPFLIRAVAAALKQVPIVNATVDGGNIIYKRDVNIGVAVALETGLIVPVIKHADEKNFLGLARAVYDLASRARAKRLSVEDVQDGTFTLSNHGVSGSLIGTPIISHPQVAILGVGKIEKRPVVRDDAIAIRAMVFLTLSFDHRALDGAVADNFMARIKSALENWDEPLL